MQNLIKKILKNEFYKGSLIFTSATFIVHFLSYCFNFLMGYSLGPSGYGEISTLFSYNSILSIPVAIFSTLLIQKIASTSTDQKAYVLSLEYFFIEKIKRYSILIALLLFLIPFIPRVTNMSPLTAYSLIPFVLISFISTFYSGAIQGMNLFFYFSIIVVIGTVVKLVGGVIAALGIGGMYTILSALFGSIIVILFLSIYFLHKSIRGSKIEVKKIDKRILHIILNKQFVVMSSSILALTLIGNVDIVFVKKFFSSYDAGIYSAWSLFSKIIMYLVAPLSAVGLVYFAGKDSNKNQHNAFLTTIILLVLVSIACYLAYSLFGSFIISLFFGNKFSELDMILKYSAIFGFIYATIILLNNFFIAKKSNLALILPVSVPMYILFLFFVPKNLLAIIYLNIGFLAAVTFLSFALYFIYLYQKQS